MRGIYSIRSIRISLLSLGLGFAALTASQAQTSRLWGQNGELWSPSSRLPDFSQAGYHGGKDPIPTRPVRANVKDFGAVGNGVADDTTAFLNAINAVSDGAILIPAGRFRITKMLRLGSNVVLRGSGKDKTTLFFPKSLTEAVGAQSRFAPAGSWSWSGGFIAAGAWMADSEVTHVTVAALRGDKTLTVASVGDLQVGQRVRLGLFESGGTLEKYLFADQASGPADRAKLVDFSFKITAISGTRITMDRPLRTDVRLNWDPTIYLDEPKTQEVGIEDLTIEFPVTVYNGHHVEPGYNAIDFGTVSNSWIRRIRIINADSGIFLRERTNFCTVQSVDYAAATGRVRRGYGLGDLGEPQDILVGGHHGVLITGVSNDNLVTDVHFPYRFIHEFGVAAYAAGNVFSQADGIDMVFDHHRRAPFENLFTAINVGLGERMWQAGGDSSDGSPGGARETFWNIRSIEGQTIPGWALQMNIVGMTGDLPSRLPTTGNWWEDILPDQLTPPNLYLAQKNRTDVVINPLPQAGSLAPNRVTAGSSDLGLEVIGSNFLKGSIVRWNGKDLTTTFVSASHLTVTIPEEELDAARSTPVTIFNPAPGGGVSGVLTFTVTAAPAPNPVPTLVSLDPVRVLAGSDGLSLDVRGTNFVAGSVIRWNGEDRPTTFGSASELTATISAEDILSAGTSKITVFNPSPGGGVTGMATFSINAPPVVNPVPNLVAMDPTKVTAGTSGFSLDITGSNFVRGSVVRWNGQNRPTTFVNSRELSAAISSQDLASVGTAPVTIFSPATGGGTSRVLTFSITAPAPLNPSPTVEALSPSHVTEGAAGFTLNITGDNFIRTSVVRWRGSDRTTTYVNENQIRAAIPAGDVTSIGGAPVTVFNPGPGGGTSPANVFEVMAAPVLNPTPRIVSLSPQKVIVGLTSLTLTITGSKFISGSVVRWNGQAHPTTFVSSTKLTATIPAADLDGIGSFPVTVSNPAPGGGTSGTLIVSIAAPPPPNPVPHVTSLNPARIIAGTVELSMRVFGTNFVAGSVVRLNGQDRDTTFVSSTQLAADIPASDVATAGPLLVTVFNPAPSGGTSTAVTLTIAPPPLLNPEPILSSLTPNKATTGASALTLRVIGLNFVRGAVVRWKGQGRPTTFVASGELTATIPATDLDSAETATVMVFNPTPGGGLSNGVNFAITGAQGSPQTPPGTGPSLSSLTPPLGLPGVGFTLTLIGTDFTPQSIVRWSGQNLPTTYISSTRLQASVTARQVPSVGTASVTVLNSAPVGTSNGLVYSIVSEASLAPVIRSLSVSPVMPVDSTITAETENAVLLTWKITPENDAVTAESPRPAGAAALVGAQTISTTQSFLRLQTLSLPTGRYSLEVTAENIRGTRSTPFRANFALVAGNLSNVRVFPNPWHSDKHSAKPYINFDQLTGNNTIKIFTIAGQHVRTLFGDANLVRWDLTNESSERVGSGLYLYLITNGAGEQTRGRLAVIR